MKRLLKQLTGILCAAAIVLSPVATIFAHAADSKDFKPITANARIPSRYRNLDVKLCVMGDGVIVHLPLTDNGFERIYLNNAYQQMTQSIAEMAQDMMDYTDSFALIHAFYTVCYQLDVGMDEESAAAFALRYAQTELAAITDIYSHAAASGKEIPEDVKMVAHSMLARSYAEVAAQFMGTPLEAVYTNAALTQIALSDQKMKLAREQWNTNQASHQTVAAENEPVANVPSGNAWAYLAQNVNSANRNIGGIFYTLNYYNVIRQAGVSQFINPATNKKYTEAQVDAIVNGVKEGAAGYAFGAPATAVSALSPHDNSKVFWYDAEATLTMLQNNGKFVLNSDNGVVTDAAGTVIAMPMK